MPLEAGNIRLKPSTWRAVRRAAQERGTDASALMRELVEEAEEAGFASQGAQAPASTSSPTPLASGAFFLKDDRLVRHYAAFDSDVGPLEEILQAYNRSKYVDKDLIRDVLRGTAEFVLLSDLERPIALDGMKFAEGRAKLETAWNRAKQSRYSPAPRGASRGPYPDAERSRKCGGCGKVYGNMSPDERRAHGGQDCRTPASSTVIVEGVAFPKSKFPAYFFDDKGELKPQFKSLEGPPTALPSPEVGGEGA